MCRSRITRASTNLSIEISLILMEYLCLKEKMNLLKMLRLPLWPYSCCHANSKTPTSHFTNQSFLKSGFSRWADSSPKIQDLFLDRVQGKESKLLSCFVCKVIGVWRSELVLFTSNFNNKDRKVNRSREKLRTIRRFREFFPWKRQKINFCTIFVAKCIINFDEPK